MTHSFRAHYFHIVWSTKNRSPWITPDLKPELYAYIGGIIKNHGVRMLEIGGMSDHVHLLLWMGIPDRFTQIIRDTKANSCSFVRKKFPMLQNFAWLEGYGSFTLSHSLIEKVCAYIKNQENHHKQVSFDDEFKKLIIMHNIDFDERFLLG